MAHYSRPHLRDCHGSLGVRPRIWDTSTERIRILGHRQARPPRVAAAPAGAAVGARFLTLRVAQSVLGEPGEHVGAHGRYRQPDPSGKDDRNGGHGVPPMELLLCGYSANFVAESGAA